MPAQATFASCCLRANGIQLTYTALLLLLLLLLLQYHCATVDSPGLL
jgi:hypothetical protein